MKIDRLILGDFQTNCYVVRRDESASDCAIIDAGLDARELVTFLAEHRLHPAAVILTHGHIDHIQGLGLLRQHLLLDSEANLSELAGADFSTDRADVLLEDGQTIEEAGLRFSVLHTPGHTPGGICLYAQPEGVLFAGDTLFAGSVGRTDFPGGSMDDLLAGIRDKLFVLPDQTVVHPGHGGRTTIGREKRCNPFLASNP
jgi:hydroxyacylglutathione hydrolase